MFVDPTRGRSQGFALVAAAAGVLALGACNDPEQNTNLRPDGDPEVLAVLVMNDAANQLVESATYCAPNDNKRPNIVGLPDFTAPNVCPDDLAKGADEVTNAYPDGWYIRIMFDELLDPSIEELTEIIDPDTMEGGTYTGSIANTHPVKLECESVGGGFVEVAYDGYYSPAGNAVTWPLGPSLVIKPNEPTSIATGKSCRVTINDNVVDKTGNKVPSTQRGAYNFKIAPLTVLAIDPSDDPQGESPVDASLLYIDDGGGVTLTFNSFVDPSSVCDEGGANDECEFTFSPDMGGVGGGALDDTNLGYGSLDPVKPKTAYTGSLKAGSKFTDRCGVVTTFGAPSVADNTLVHITTNEFKLSATSPSTGDTVSAMKKPTLIFTNEVDAATFVDPGDYSISPPPETPTLVDGGSALLLGGYYKLNTDYTVTIKAGAMITDLTGAVYTQTAAKTITYKTQPAITVGTAPADLATLTRAGATSSLGVTLTFNQAMDAASLLPTEYSLTSTQVIPALTVTPTGCGAASTSCSFKIAGLLLPGDYTFTLKAGTTINDKLTPSSTYTQAADKVIHFTVKNAATAPPPVTCL